jgi:large subunit ribosomal protein L6
VASAVKFSALCGEALMSRIGKKNIPVPAGVEITLSGTNVVVKGPKGQLSRDIGDVITITREGDELVVTRPNEERMSKALHGLTRTLVANMVTGVTAGYVKELEIVGTGYRAQAKGNDKLELALGYSHSVNVSAPAGITFDVPLPTKVTVQGIDKELVGQVAADIRKLRKPEPYKGKGVRYVGEHVRRKAGKAGKK